MPFMKGPSPIRRTIKYLDAGRLVFKDPIKVCSVHYNFSSSHHQGTKDFSFWFIPQIQYKNPHVQILKLTNMTPTPFIRFFYDTGDQLVVDTFNKSKEEIIEHLIKVVGKSKDTLQAETVAREKKDNPANFGMGCERNCICEIPGQIPCPGICPLPKHWRGKYKFNKVVE